MAVLPSEAQLPPSRSADDALDREAPSHGDVGGAQGGSQSEEERLAQLLAPEERRLVTRLLAAMGFFAACSWIGSTFSLYLVEMAPLLLVALSPLGRNLLLTALVVPPVAFVVVATVRRLVFYALTFRLGRALGPYGVPWLEARIPVAARFVKFFQRVYAWHPRLIVFLFTGPILSTVAGMSQLPTRTFLTLAGAGLVVRMVVTLYVAEFLRPQIEWVLEVIHEYRAPGTVVLVVIALGYHLWQKRKARLTAGHDGLVEPASPE